MEEHVGVLWHRLITRAASREQADAAVTLDQVRGSVGVLFRALGGPCGLRIEAANATAHGARRGWLQRIAGSGERMALAWCDAEALRLPERVARYPSAGLNRDLYLWLAALAARSSAASGGSWFLNNQKVTTDILTSFPGLAARYRRLVAAELALRPDPAKLPDDEARQEEAIQAALVGPGSRGAWPPARRPPQPVPLWLHPEPPIPVAAGASNDGDDPAPPDGDGQVHDPEDGRRHAAERVAMPESDRGLLAVRFESIFSWAEYLPVDRGTEENDDLSDAARDAEALDRLSVARDRRSTASRVRFDLDLPAASEDDLPLGPGIRLPEWDYRRALLRPDHCLLQEMTAADAQPCALPERLERPARQLRAQFQSLAPTRVWRRGEADGPEIDLDAYLRFETERAAGETTGGSAEPALYRDLRVGHRDLACLLLADLSLSTDAWVNDHARVIDVTRDALFLFAEALAALGDRFALAGFSSRRRDNVRYYRIKPFDGAYNAACRGRIQAIKPGFYTRMGAAIRHASAELARQPAGRRLLLLLTDGKPNDLDLYEGRYGIEDTRMALYAARRQGLQPFCVTIDKHGGDYLPHLFGTQGYVVIRRPEELPQRLPLLYAQLAG